VRHFLKICDGIDVSMLRNQLDVQPELWNVHSSRMQRPGTPFRGTDDIWVRYNDLAKAMPDFVGFNDEHVPVWYPAWNALPALRPIIFNLMARVQGEMLGGVLITRVPAGSEIKPHVDHGWHVEQYRKFYISIESEPGADFVCEHGGVKETLNPKPGSCWLFDNRKLHWVVNRSGKARVTLIVCVRTEMYGMESVRFLGDSRLPQPLQSAER